MCGCGAVALRLYYAAVCRRYPAKTVASIVISKKKTLMSLQQRTARAPSSGCNILKLDFTRVMLSSSLITSLVSQRRFGDAEHLQGAALFRLHVQANDITDSDFPVGCPAKSVQKTGFFSLLRPFHSVAAAEFQQLADSSPQRQGANTDGSSVIFISIFMNS